MLAVTTKLLPVARNIARQIVPPVLATLIAALLIAGFNRAFTGHLVQPRMAALHGGAGETTRPIVYAANPHGEVAATEVATVAEPAVPERIFAKDDASEAGKDQTALKLATAAPVAPAAPAPVTPRVVTRKAEPQMIEQRQVQVQAQVPEQRQVQMQVPEQRQIIAQREPRVAAAPVIVAPVPAMVAPAPVIVAPPVVAQPIAPMLQPMAPPMQPTASALPPVAPEPPPVIAAKPMVTVPDRPRPAYPGYEQRAPYDQQAGQDIAPPREPRPLERFVDSLKPSSIFNRMREFGDRIEAAGNEILPNIRQ